MKRALVILCTVFVLLVSSSCGKSKASTPVATPTPTPYEQQVKTPAGPYPWWEEDPAFGAFPQYTFGGKPESGFESGPGKFSGYSQFALYAVKYDDYKGYLDKMKESGFPLDNPYGEFVDQAEVDLAAFNGAATYVSGAYTLNLRYDLRAQKLIIQVDVH